MAEAPPWGFSHLSPTGRWLLGHGLPTTLRPPTSVLSSPDWAALRDECAGNRLTGLLVDAVATGALATDDAQAAVNAVTVTRDPSGAMPPGMVQANLGSDHLGFNNLNGWIQRLAFYPSRIPDTMLRSLSA